MRALRLLLLTLVAPPLLAQDGQPSGARFAWPIPLRLEALETSTKDGKVAKQRHVVRAWRDEASGELRVHVQDSELLEFNGKDFRTPEAKAEAGALLSQMSFPYPAWRIDREGAFLGAVDFETSIARWIELLLRVAPPERKRELTRVQEDLRSPAMMATHLQAMRDMWDAWSGAWVGASPVPGTRLELRRTTVLFGTPVEAPGVLEVLERRPDGAPLRVRRTTQVGGEAARAAFAAFLERVTPPGAPKPAVKDYAATLVLLAETDPATLVPTLASLQRREVIEVEGRPRREKEEQREWTFRPLPAQGE